MSDDLLAGWTQITDDAVYTVDIGIECSGKAKMPKFPSKRADETSLKFERKLEDFDQKAKKAYQTWDALKIQREESLERFITAYQGNILQIADGQTKSLYEVPDSFTVRAQISGRGFRDLVLNFPFVFEVSSPDEVSMGTSIIMGINGQENVTIEAPDDDAPQVVVIDSGIQENHPLLSAAISTSKSINYVPGAASTAVADLVQPSGHGTRVAGAILYPQAIPRGGTYKLPFKIINARVLDASNCLSSSLFPPLLLKMIVNRFHIISDTPVRIFNHSVSSRRPCNLKHMSSWATAIDDLSFENDVLFVQATGNLPCDSADPIQKGISNHLSSGENYPQYLFSKSSRIANPSQSMQALTVGSISIDLITTPDTSSICQNAGEPSSFTRSGLGIWDSIKPDVVDYGGDFVVDATACQRSSISA